VFGNFSKFFYFAIFLNGSFLGAKICTNKISEEKIFKIENRESIERKE